MTFILGRLVVERIDPKNLLRNLTFDRAVIFPSSFKAQAADWRFPFAFDLHVPERRCDRLWRCGAVGQFGEADKHVNEQILIFAVVRFVPRAQVKIRTLHSALRTRDTEHF